MTFDMDAPIAHQTGAETREGGHVMMMHFNTGLPLGEMLFKNWVVENETDLAWVSNAAISMLISNVLNLYSMLIQLGDT